VSTIVATVGEPFEVELPERPPTGYQWRLEPVPEGVEILEAPFSPPPPGKLGAAGLRRFVLRATRPGVLDLCFRSARWWREDAPVEQSVEVRVRALPPAPHA
jgi:predicted secreted protein